MTPKHTTQVRMHTCTHTAFPLQNFMYSSLLLTASVFPHFKLFLNWTAMGIWANAYVTGFWKTDQNITIGQLHFLGPANSHTHTLSMHCCNTRLSCLVCFSRADFADHVKSRLRQWDPWRALDGRYGSDIHPCVSETSLRPSRLV